MNTNVRITISQHFLRHKTDTKSEKIKCIQISLQHARLATDNLNKTIEEDSIDTLRIQEPYQIRNKIVGFPRGLKIFKAGAGKHRAAIGVNNAQIDAIMINQLSDEDAAALGLTLGNTKLLLPAYTLILLATYTETSEKWKPLYNMPVELASL